MRLLIIQLVCCLAWLSSFCFAQLDLSEGITGSVNFPTLGITCLGNLAVLVTSLIRGRLALEIGARDVLHILASRKLRPININGTMEAGLTTSASRKLRPININGTMETGLTTSVIDYSSGLTTEDVVDYRYVVMLSNGKPNSSIREFMMLNANYVHSILLQFFPLKAAATHLGVAANAVEMCPCHYCNCIIFRTTEDITYMLAGRMPGTLKLLTDPTLCLLPCVTCIGKGCHGCNRESVVSRSEESVVSDILDNIHAGSITAGKPICICIPLKDARNDKWTELLIRSLRSKDTEGRGVRVMASEALEGYLAGRGGQQGEVEYHIASLIVPRLTEILINLALTFWFTVDGFSSSLVARRTVRDYLVDSKGNGFAANAFLSKAVVKSNANNTQVCQVLTFRGNLVSIRCLSSVVASVNLISSIGWVLLIVFKGGADISPPLSELRIAVIISAIGFTLAMHMLAVKLAWGNRILEFLKRLVCGWDLSPVLLYLRVVFFLEIVCTVSGSVVAGTLGVKAFGRWVYGVLQTLVWMKWGIGAYFLEVDYAAEFSGRDPHSLAIMVYSSSFFLNAVLAGVRCHWGRWPWNGES